jgi:hypothetical protein
MDILNKSYYFATEIFNLSLPEYVDVVRETANSVMNKNQGFDELYPMYMSDNFADNPKISELIDLISKHAWHILNDQGYYMGDKNTIVTEFWMQEHYKHSGMDMHTHNFPTQLVGFYLLDCPEKCSRIIFADSRAGKVQNSMYEKQQDAITYASNLINFPAEAGTLWITNASVPHGFSRHGSDNPMRFIHFCVSVVQSPISKAEVI